MTDAVQSISGGCQCGAVRFACEALGPAAICHCRMCQKAFGHFYGPFVTGIGVTWIRGSRKLFRSSNAGQRGFCGDCGTPLTFEIDGATELAIGALDEPSLAAPTRQLNPNDKLPFVDHLADLPTRTAAEMLPLDARMPGFINFQHPDHDTSKWPMPADPSASHL